MDNRIWVWLPVCMGEGSSSTFVKVLADPEGELPDGAIEDEVETP